MSRQLYSVQVDNQIELSDVLLEGALAYVASEARWAQGEAEPVAIALLDADRCRILEWRYDPTTETWDCWPSASRRLRR